jgi:pimeloyl-ACP methyl ester carboxylesterase
MPFPPGAVAFLHGLESAVDDDLIPCGGKASFLRERHGAALVALDTRAAVAAAARAGPGWAWPFPDYDAAFAIPLARARAAVGPQTRLVIGSSFGGAVLLRLLIEGGWRGPSLFLAGAGPKLTPHRALPPGVPALLIHGTRDDVVPIDDSRALEATSATAALWEVDDGHRLGVILHDGTLDRAIAHLIGDRSAGR